ncbi:MAG: ArnT family glycosyltransferase [Hyphomicrobiaceae bacterium]
MRPLTAPALPRPAVGAWALLVAALLGLLAFRLAALRFNATDLFFDEAQYWSWSREPAFGYYSKPPLVAWLIGLSATLCGDSPFCIRLPAPLIHTAAAFVIFAIGNRLHGPRVGLWSALTFATLPGISLSSAIMSTDVPLLLAWAVALWAYVTMREDEGWLPAIILGLALGVGLNAKYAMVFFVGCMAVHMAVTPAARRLLADPRLWTALALGALLIAPNMAWNMANSFATFAHTADNAKWGGALVNIGKGFEFVGAQFGVFGPILFATLLLTARRAWNEGLAEADRLLLCFTLPVLMLISAQAFVSRAHANWAATAYVAASILVTATLVRLIAERWLKISMAVHAVVLLAMAGGAAAAGRFTLPLVGDPFQRTLGWQAVADATRQQLDKARTGGQPFKAVISDERAVTAELLYYMREETTPVQAWREGRPKDHYELTRPFKDAAQVPVLLVAFRQDTDRILKRFSTVEPLGQALLPAGLGPPRPVRFYRLSGFRP